MAVDVAYGYTACSALPRGLFDPSCAPYALRKKLNDGSFSQAVCPNQAGAQGFCDGDMSARNADTYSFIAAGIYFNRQCNRAIPHPPPLTAKRDTSAVARETVPAVEASNKRESKPMIPPKKEARHPHGSGRRTQTGRKQPRRSRISPKPGLRAVPTSTTSSCGTALTKNPAALLATLTLATRTRAAWTRAPPKGIRAASAPTTTAT
jgi:hypothetical protein